MWMRAQGETWVAAGAAFVGAWALMMIVMMAPALAPSLVHYRRADGRPHLTAAVRRLALVAAGYYAVWIAFGAAAYPLGLLLREAEGRVPSLTRAIPVAAGAALVLVGCMQFTRWKMRQLEACRSCAPSALRKAGAWRDGLRLGAHCCVCCTAFMLLLFNAGMMRPANVALVAVLIAAERLAPRPAPVVRAAGLVVLAFGATWIVEALSRS